MHSSSYTQRERESEYAYTSGSNPTSLQKQQKPSEDDMSGNALEVDIAESRLVF